MGGGDGRVESLEVGGVLGVGITTPTRHWVRRLGVALSCLHCRRRRARPPWEHGSRGAGSRAASLGSSSSASYRWAPQLDCWAQGFETPGAVFVWKASRTENEQHLFGK